MAFNLFTNKIYILTYKKVFNFFKFYIYNFYV